MFSDWDQNHDTNVIMLQFQKTHTNLCWDHNRPSEFYQIIIIKSIKTFLNIKSNPNPDLKIILNTMFISIFIKTLNLCSVWHYNKRNTHTPTNWPFDFFPPVFDPEHNQLNNLLLRLTSYRNLSFVSLYLDEGQFPVSLL